MAYGNAGITTDQSDRTNVWDSNYVTVLHMASTPTLSALDSTSNSNNGTIAGATAVTGVVGSAADFDNDNDEIDFGSSLNTALNSSAFTINFWLNQNVNESSVPFGNRGQTGSRMIGYNAWSTNQLAFFEEDR